MDQTSRATIVTQGIHRCIIIVVVIIVVAIVAMWQMWHVLTLVQGVKKSNERNGQLDSIKLLSLWFNDNELNFINLGRFDHSTAAAAVSQD